MARLRALFVLLLLPFLCLPAVRAQTTFSIGGAVTEGTAGVGGVSVQAIGLGQFNSAQSVAPGIVIPDSSSAGIESPLGVGATGTVTSVQVVVNITHPRVNDLQISLVHPDGTAVLLQNDDPYGPAETNLLKSYPPSTPAQSLSAFTARPTNGTWRLVVRDLRSGNTGTLNEWALFLGYSNTVTQTQTTAANGTYSLGGLPPGTYTVTPSGAGYTFNPASRTVTVGPDRTGQDFAASGPSAVSGTVTANDRGLRRATIQVVGTGTFSVSQTATPGLRIPDDNSTGIESLLPFSGTGAITGVSVSLNISHARANDLQVSLVHPDGTTVLLRNSDPFSPGQINLVASYPPSAPVQSLSAFTARPAAGAWKLVVKDLRGGNVGILNYWTLTLTYTSTVARLLATAPDGSYVLNGLAPGTYTVTASRSGYTFSPASRSVTLGPSQASQNFLGGAIAAWTAGDLATGTDNRTRLLWNRFDGAVSLWTVSALFEFENSFEFGPFTGWSANGVAVGSDGKARLLWNHADGRISLWTVTPTGAVESSYEFGPYAGWTGWDIAVGSDNQTRVLWKNASGRISLWTVAPTGGLESSFEFGPFTGWSANALSVSSDGRARLLWNHTDGRASFWTVANGVLENSIEYGPFAGWTAWDVAGEGGRTRPLWRNIDGRVSLWTLSAVGGLESSFEFGPFTGGWAGNTLSVGADGKARLLWNNTLGRVSLWSVTPGGALETSQEYGPF